MRNKKVEGTTFSFLIPYFSFLISLHPPSFPFILSKLSKKTGDNRVEYMKGLKKEKVLHQKLLTEE